jgi:Ser/Thr protein kinase RdoA (MazF antagonist)
MVEPSVFGDTPRPAGRLEATPNRIGRATDTELLKRLCGSGQRERGVHVRTLPDSPSLDYLRRQAKDLLVGMRQAQPESLIQLADAQMALAQQYGFRTWAELKAEVDRRHGGAQIAAPALAELIATRFGLGTVTAAMKSVAPANEVGRAWALDTDTGRWTIKELTSWYGVDDVAANAETDVRLQEAALATGVLVPRPVRSVSGSIVECIDGQNWRVNEWVPSGPPLSAPVNDAIAHEAGALLARLHALGLRPDRPMEPWYTPINTPDDWAGLAASASAHQVDWAATLDGVLASIGELWSMATSVAPPPTILCHCGFGPTNARRAREGGLVVLGWEHAGAFPPTWEVANALWAWSVGPHRNAADAVAARSFIDGYRGVTGYDPALNLTCFAAEAAAWLNYAYGQVRCALDTADPDQRQFMHRNVRHLLEHAPSVALFERVLESVSTTGVG